jgi:hypothetical protein
MLALSAAQTSYQAGGMNALHSQVDHPASCLIAVSDTSPARFAFQNEALVVSSKEPLG